MLGVERARWNGKEGLVGYRLVGYMGCFRCFSSIVITLGKGHSFEHSSLTYSYYYLHSSVSIGLSVFQSR